MVPCLLSEAVILQTRPGQGLSAIKPSDVRAWRAVLGEQYAPSTAYAVYRRFSQVMSAAVEDGLIPRSPCSRTTSPPQADQRPYVATTEQVWQLHDAMPENLRVAVTLGAFAGLRVGEACGLRVGDVDWQEGVIRPAVQYPAEPLKTEMSKTSIPIPAEMVADLEAHVRTHGAEHVVTNAWGDQASPAVIEHAVRAARGAVDGLPEGFRHHDLRHYYTSLLISQGLDIKSVQTRLRHKSATTTLNTYGHMFPDQDESARAAVASAYAGRADSVRTAGDE